MLWLTFRGVNTFTTIRDKQSERRKAGANFVAEFSAELSTIKNRKPGEDINVRSLLINSFDKHRNAYIKFHAILPKRAAVRIERDWKAYYHSENDFGKEWPHHESMNFFGDYLAINEKEKFKAINLAISRIEELLSNAQT